MPSPFPGMNPYLERDAAWDDFHNRFIVRAADAVAAQVDPRYIVRIEDQIYLHEKAAKRRRRLGRGDVVAKGGRSPGPTSAAVATLAPVAAPVRVVLPEVEEERKPFIQIRDRDLQQVVTVLELLSPTNKKPGGKRRQYLHKRNVILNSSVHLVEIDLFRSGERMPGAEGDFTYSVLVSRAADRPEAGLWPVKLRERLPVVPVPLNPGDADARLDMQEILNIVYDAARYATYLYEARPNPPLSAEDAAWAEGLLPRPAQPANMEGERS
jgi:hypothetical protein